ncbi:MAG: DUF362 domain-containing protein [Oscillospiraceae bacterium]|nr:DUF362 domain-containing protein [Oscillospiraceae bacterium]
MMNKVYFARTPDYSLDTVYDSVKSILLYYGMDKMVSAEATILLKPNMLSRSVPDKAVTTHPAVVDAVMKALTEMGAKAENITIADSGGGPSNPALNAASYKTCGYTDVAVKYGAKVYTKYETVTVKTDGVMVKEFELLEPVVNSDIVINLAKFKTHVMTGMSAAVKNLFGCVPGLKKAEFHMRFPDKEPFSAMMVDLCQTVNPTLTIVDAVTGMEGDGPGSGNPVYLGMLVAGDNPYYTDLAVCNMMGFDPMHPPIMAQAINRGLVPDKLPQDCIRGDTDLYAKLENFALPHSYRIDFGDRVPRALRWATPTVEKFLAPKPKIKKAACIGCGKCHDICPGNAIKIVNKKAIIDYNKCIKCFCCHEMCPVKAIDVKRSIFFNI